MRFGTVCQRTDRKKLRISAIGQTIAGYRGSPEKRKGPGRNSDGSGFYIVDSSRLVAYNG